MADYDKASFLYKVSGYLQLEQIIVLNPSEMSQIWTQSSVNRAAEKSDICSSCF